MNHFPKGLCHFTFQQTIYGDSNFSIFLLIHGVVYLFYYSQSHGYRDILLGVVFYVLYPHQHSISQDRLGYAVVTSNLQASVT